MWRYTPGHVKKFIGLVGFFDLFFSPQNYINFKIIKFTHFLLFFYPKFYQYFYLNIISISISLLGLVLPICTWRLGYICLMWLEFLNVYNRTKQQQNPNFWLVTLAYPIFVTFIENMTLNTLTNTNLCNAVNSR